MKPMGEIIKEERIKAGLTQTELGEMLGVQKNAVCKWEKGRVLHIGQDKLYLMAKIFGVSPSYLLGFDESKEVAYNLKITSDEVAKVVAIANDLDKQRLKMLVSYARFLSENVFSKKDKGKGSDAE